jgi:hypothetical protein
VDLAELAPRKTQHLSLGVFILLSTFRDKPFNVDEAVCPEGGWSRMALLIGQEPGGRYYICTSPSSQIAVEPLLTFVGLDQG